MLPPPLQGIFEKRLEGYLKRGSRGSHAAICSKLTSKMLKEAIRFHYSWQPNFLTTDMIVSLVGSYVGHAMIRHKKIEKNVGNEMS